MIAHIKLSPSNRQELLFGIGFIVCVLLSAFLYWPGISGDFLLDDYENLRKLEEISGNGFHELINFVSTGLSSRSGRPVSLLSFALQHYEFPHSQAFKYVNVLLHLLNGCLVFWVVILIARISNLFGEKGNLIALVTAAIWLIHPLQISTVHYVIQRMAELSAMFTLIGLIMYLTGRQHIAKDKPLPGFLWMSLGIVVGGILATFSKENGILLPLYVLALEYTLLKNLPKPPFWKLWVIIFLVTPLLILFGYIGLNFKGVVINAYSHRDFTLGERLLTETRILSDYLSKIFIPLPNELGLYHDDFSVSKSLFNPIQTLVSTFFLLFLIASAIYSKARLPIYSFGILWFFSGHILESTVIPLELYFEHRNYLPIFGIILATVFYLTRLPKFIQDRRIKRLTIGFIALYACTIGIVSYNENMIWGNTYRQAIVWAKENPQSRRAQDALGAVLTAMGQYREAASVYERMSVSFPEDSFPYVIWLSLTCLDNTIDPPLEDIVISRLRQAPFYLATLVGFDRIIEAKESRDCEAVEYEDLVRMLDAVMDNPNYKKHAMYVHLHLGRLHASQRLLAPAIAEYDKAFASSRDPNIALRQVEWLYSAGLYEQAQIYLEKAEQAVQRNAAQEVALDPILSKWREILSIQLKSK